MYKHITYLAQDNFGPYMDLWSMNLVTAQGDP